jgi:glycosyltransferase involved in cell wall biosynthesis
VLQAMGHRTRVVSTQGDQLWAPLQGTPFAQTCSILTPEALSDLVATDTDLLVAVKALPHSLGLAWRLARRHGVPLLADVDDPDVEVRTTWRPRAEVLEDLRRHPAQFAGLRLLRDLARRLPSTVSNPVLQDIYGGEVVPHARVDRGAGAPHTSSEPVLGFVGTVRAHKGVDDLRTAVSRLSADGWGLLVTADPPPDPRPWEFWVGPNPPDTRVLLDTSDVVVIANDATSYGRAQLPLKVVDAMLSGRAVVVSDMRQLRWAVGRAAPAFPPGDTDALVAALRPLRDPAVRARLGAEARREALARFTPEAVAPALDRALHQALARASRRRPAPLDGSRTAEGAFPAR